MNRGAGDILRKMAAGNESGTPDLRHRTSESGAPNRETLRGGTHLSPSEFAARFQECWPTLWYIAAAVLGERSGAEDVLQEAAMIALGKLWQFDTTKQARPSAIGREPRPDSQQPPAQSSDPKVSAPVEHWRGGDPFVAWMSRIVRLTALNHARRRIKRIAQSTDPGSLDQFAADASRGGRGGGRGEPATHDTSAIGITCKGELVKDNELFDDRVEAALRSLDETARACLLLRTLMQMPYRQISLVLDIAEGTAMSHVHRARAVLREKLGLAYSSSARRDANSKPDQSLHATSQDTRANS
jgi:RNA polymerase sigma-70 factor (ECF subfamily)